MDEYWIFDKEKECFIGNIFYSFEAAEDFVMKYGGYYLYDIFRKES